MLGFDFSLLESGPGYSLAPMTNTFGFRFDNTYARLPEALFAKVNPVPVPQPKIAILNLELANELNLNLESLASESGAALFAGNFIPEGAEPLAQAYAGHQFGGFRMLGDGRAHLLGEHLTSAGSRFDIQLKGSGPTPFSRRGDGRAALGPMLREYIISEAMHALKIPTTRSLAVVTTGQPTLRETPLPGAILTRVASSHIRIGTFEYASSIEGSAPIRALSDYTIQRHYPELASHTESYVELLRAVIERQASLLAKWMHVGFIHGVMNTDNITLSGETIDYGPCAFMNKYSPSTVFSSIDHDGRYAFGNQPRITAWNLERLSESLLPLFSAEENKAIAKAEEALSAFAPTFERFWLEGMRAKLGLRGENAEDLTLIGSLLRWMDEHGADYTDTFRELSKSASNGSRIGDLFKGEAFQDWQKRWQARGPAQELMLATNPAFIPRNHRVEEALAAATDFGDYTLMNRLLKALKSPFEESEEDSAYLAAPDIEDESYKTFCGT